MEPQSASEDFFLALWVVVVDISQFPADWKHPKVMRCFPCLPAVNRFLRF